MKKNNLFDVIIIGAGPIGAAFACSLADTDLNIAIVDKLSKKKISHPKIDGREIALTHKSIKILKNLNLWNYIPKKSIKINEKN